MPIVLDRCITLCLACGERVLNDSVAKELNADGVCCAAVEYIDDAVHFIHQFINLSADIAFTAVLFPLGGERTKP